MRRLLIGLACLIRCGASLSAEETNATANAVVVNSRLLRPLSVAEALDIALQQNSSIRKSTADLEAMHGVVIQTRAIALPKVGVSSSYTAIEDSSIDRFQGNVRVQTPVGTTNFNFGDAFEFANQRWLADIRVTQ